MKKRFSEEQIIGFLKEAGTQARSSVPGRHRTSHLQEGHRSAKNPKKRGQA
ncbi:MAG: hypothetical protein ACLGHR_03440 [Gammaproteobacteria bacterium]